MILCAVIGIPSPILILRCNSPNLTTLAQKRKRNMETGSLCGKNGAGGVYVDGAIGIEVSLIFERVFGCNLLRD